MIYGWDISTSIVGLARFDNDGSFQGSSYLDLRKTDGQLLKALAFKQWLDQNLHPKDGSSYHFVEERLGGFAGGRTSAQVLMKLAQFNAICSYILWTHDVGHHCSVMHLHPSSWKSIMKFEGLLIPKGSDKKKELTVAFVKRKEPKFAEFIQQNLNRNEKPQPWVTDCADAYCIGRAGYLKLCKEKESSLP